MPYCGNIKKFYCPHVFAIIILLPLLFCSRSRKPNVMKQTFTNVAVIIILLLLF